jgi:glycosyltransferase involved in cell wall biosynthesis
MAERNTVTETGCFVSVIVPVFNRERFLRAALDSVLAQTFTGFEIVAVDDGSTDSSPVILHWYQERFPGKVRVISQKNAGPSVARNAAIMVARGTYISFLDSDDLWPPEKLERQLPLFAQHDDIAFIYTGYCLMDESGELLEERRPLPYIEGNIHDKIWANEDNISGGTLMVARERLMQAGLFDAELRGAENLDLRIRLSKLGNVYFCDDLLYFYRIHRQNLIASSDDMYLYHLLLLQKHFGANGEKNRKMWKSIRSRQLYMQGGELLQKTRYVEAAGALWQSILLNPRRPRAYINLMRCFLGKRVNQWLVGIKTGLSRS